MLKNKNFLKNAVSLLLSGTLLFNSNLSTSAMNGIDVSVFQGDIDWEAVKAAGIDFAIIRTSYGKEDYANQTDKKYLRNVICAKSAGISIGAYHYSYARNTADAIQEAKFFIAKLKVAQWEYPVFLDMEDKQIADLDKNTLTDIAITFAETMREAGYYPGIYACLDWANNKLDMRRLYQKGVQVWIAQWNEKCDYKGLYSIWQKSCKGRVPGIQGDVDLDVCNREDYPQFIKALHKNGF